MRFPRDAISTWEDFAEDAAAVVNAVGSEQATILAFGEWVRSLSC